MLLTPKASDRHPNTPGSRQLTDPTSTTPHGAWVDAAEAGTWPAQDGSGDDRGDGAAVTSAPDPMPSVSGVRAAMMSSSSSKARRTAASSSRSRQSSGSCRSGAGRLAGRCRSDSCPERYSRRFVEQVVQARRALGDDQLPRIRVHDLRHTHATLLLPAGDPVKVVSERLGTPT
jgi:hypothetical protein